MDRKKETSNIIKQLNLLRQKKISDFDFIHFVCEYFDKIKTEKINNDDLNFLVYLASKCGIPQFYSMLKNFKINTQLSNLSLLSASALINEANLYTSETSSLHKFQKQILENFSRGYKNRFLLTASTSFGKTHIIYEIIRKMDYTNILLVFPSIALLSENLDRIITNPNYSFLKENYDIHTLSEINEFGRKNIFIYTPERYLSFLENNPDYKFDFIFIDEIYKIDNDFEIDNEVKENERDTAYRLAAYFSVESNSDILLAGPYIEDFQESFLLFLRKYGIKQLDYNHYEIVNKYFYTKQKNRYVCENDFENEIFPVISNKGLQVVEISKSIIQKKQNIIIYVPQRGKRGGTEYYAEKLLSDDFFNDYDTSSYSQFLCHLKNRYSSGWIVVKALEHGIGIHHGMVPKYIQKQIIALFNEGKIKILLSTTTITEGVNTAAKYLLITGNKKGNKDLKPFDAKNIAGRAGRFTYHYSGKVIDISKDFLKTLDSSSDKLRYKNYEKTIDKNEVDIFNTDEDFLTANDKVKKSEIIRKQKELNIPDEILSKYRIVSKMDKLFIYEKFMFLNFENNSLIEETVEQYYSFLTFNIKGFDFIFDLIFPIVKNEDLKALYHKGVHPYYVLTYKMSNYMKKGFFGIVDYNLGKSKSYDESITDAAKFTYNILRYQIVKYLGVFNLMYKYYQSQKKHIVIEKVHGLDKLLRKIEYNAVSDLGRRISDYGVPEKIVDFYETRETNKSKSRRIKSDFDDYENMIFERVNKIIQ